MLKTLILILLANNFVFSFSVLLDNFTDPNDLINPKDHLITKGSDFIGKLNRSFANNTGHWSFLSDGGVSFSNQYIPYGISYSFEDRMQLNDFNEVKFNFSRVPLNNYHRLLFWSSNGAYCQAFFKFESTNNEQIIELEEIKQKSKFFPSKGNLASFDENDISDLRIDFNCKDIFTYQNNQPNDCILDSIEMVPEPFTIITLGSGLMKLVRRKDCK